MASTWRVWVEETGINLGDRILMADGFWSRFWGLMGRPNLAEGEGLWLSPCDSIHMFFMRFPIDVAYLDADDRVLRLVLGLRPWRVGPWLPRSKAVLELPAGTLARAQLREGQRLRREASS